jgi:hypothetical protein
MLSISRAPRWATALGHESTAGANAGQAREVAMQRILPAVLVVIALAACDARTPDSAVPTAPEATRAGAPAAPAAPQVIVSGLLYPRGFTFGRDGAIYVAEAGVPEGNDMSTAGQCAQVAPPTGPWLGGFTGRVSRVTMAGQRTTVADHLPSARNNLGDVDGVSDVAFAKDGERGPGNDDRGARSRDEKLYVLSGAGCSRGHADDPSRVLRLEPHGHYTTVANLSRWIHEHPVANPNPPDFEPDGDWYNMASSGNTLYLVEANQGNLVSVRPDGGRIRRVADVSATEDGHVVPTGLSVSRSDDDLYVGELRAFPAVPGSANVIIYERNGQVEDRLHGFTAIVGVANDRSGNVYVLESFNCATTEPCFPSPGTGRVVRVSSNGTRDVVAAGLSFPTGLRLGPDGALYVSNFSFGPPRMGQIVRIPL